MLQNLSRHCQRIKNPIGHLILVLWCWYIMPCLIQKYQPYQHLISHNAQTLCDNWLGLSQYNCSKFISKDLWGNQQYDLVKATNKWVLKSIQQGTQRSAERLGGKSLEIPEGNLDLLQNNPECCNKI